MGKPQRQQPYQAPAPQQVTLADLDELLNLLPASEAHVATMARYGDNFWEPIRRAREKLEQLKGKF